MLQHLTSSTLEKMYKDLDKSRLDLLKKVNEETLVNDTAEYHNLTNFLEEIDKQYKANTGEDLWVKVILHSINS